MFLYDTKTYASRSQLPVRAFFPGDASYFAGDRRRRGHCCLSGPLVRGVKPGKALIAFGCSLPRARLLHFAPFASPCFERRGSRMLRRWCVSAQRVEYRSELGAHRAKGQFALVQLKVVSQARRVYQSEKLAKVEIRGDDGTWRAPPPDAQGYLTAGLGVQPSLAQRIGPGESLSTVLVFDVPLNTRQIALRMNHGNGPSCFIIGESRCLRSGTEFRLTPQRAF
jgi:hypothetical protein